MIVFGGHIRQYNKQREVIMLGVLRSDANLVADVNTITVEAISLIEKELQTHDVVSMVFLLYDKHDTALKQLTVLEREDTGGGGDLLSEWAQSAQSQSTWRHKFLEALAVCQLPKIIRQLGIQVDYVKKHYQPKNIHVAFHVNPMKKALYLLCENITCDYLDKLKGNLRTYDCDTTEYKHCELVFLELMCKEFIIVNNPNEKKDCDQYFQIESLATVIDHYPKLRKFACDLRQIERRYKVDQKLSSPITSSTPTPKSVQDEPKECYDEDDKLTANAFQDLYKYLNEIDMEETPVKNLKSDTKRYEGAYEIKNSKRLGVCYIINQEQFYPSKTSIESLNTPLDKRLGSDRDRNFLENTMASLKFEVICHSNLPHKQMMEYIKEIIYYRVHYDDSMFMLCILSHGVRGHIYATDCVKVKIDDIQNLLDEGFQKRKLYDIPKVMILQACQVNNSDPQPPLVADGPVKFVRKSDFLVYWATAPELEAYRDERKGSIFIQMLCCEIKDCARNEHLYDIFTRVTDKVVKICTAHNREQIPLFESTLRKKLYLHFPE